MLNFISESEQLTDEVELLQLGILNVQVCSSVGPDETLEVVRKHVPLGLSAGSSWVHDDREEVAPIQCTEKKTHKHYVFTC